jgi:hypothetical protein
MTAAFLLLVCQEKYRSWGCLPLPLLRDDDLVAVAQHLATAMLSKSYFLVEATEQLDPFTTVKIKRLLKLYRDGRHLTRWYH